MTTREISSKLSERTDTFQMGKSLRSWIILFLIIGGLSIFASQTLDPAWGVILILVAVLSLKNKMPGMFILYGVIIAWAAVNNFFSSFIGGFAPQWLVLAIVQVVWSISVIKQYSKYRHLQSDRQLIVLGHFGKASTIISAVVLVLPPLIALGVFIYYATLGEAALMGLSAKINHLPENLVGIVMSGLVDSTVLALGLGITAVASSGKRGWGIAGIVISSIVLAGVMCMFFLAITGELATQQGVLPGGV